jgi:hypothetical protein
MIGLWKMIVIDHISHYGIVPHLQHTSPEISSIFRAIAVEKTTRVFGRVARSCYFEDDLPDDSESLGNVT